MLEIWVAHDTRLTLLHCYNVILHMILTWHCYIATMWSCTWYSLDIATLLLFCIRNRAAFQLSCHFSVPFGLGCLWNTPPINFVCMSGRCPYEVRVCFPSNRECNSHCPVSTHPSPPIVVTSHICSQNPSQNPSPMGLLARDEWNFEICWVYDLCSPMMFPMTFTICSPCVFRKNYPRWCFAKCHFHCSQKFQCVSLSHVFGQVFPPYVCSQCSHLTYVYIPYVLQNAPNPVPNTPQILSHKLCLKCSLTLSIWHRMWYNCKNHKAIHQKSSNVAKKVEILEKQSLNLRPKN